jgi:hypothetical protein
LIPAGRPGLGPIPLPSYIAYRSPLRQRFLAFCVRRRQPPAFRLAAPRQERNAPSEKTAYNEVSRVNETRPPDGGGLSFPRRKNSPSNAGAAGGYCQSAIDNPLRDEKVVRSRQLKPPNAQISRMIGSGIPMSHSSNPRPM